MTTTDPTLMHRASFSSSEFPLSSSTSTLSVRQDEGQMEPVPEYSETDNSDIFAHVEEIQASSPAMAAALNLPLTSYPTTPVRNASVPLTRASTGENPSNGGSRGATSADTAPLSFREFQDIYTLQTSVIASFFTSILSRRDDVVTSFVTRGLVSPDVPNVVGQTPLLAAVSASNPSMVRTLITLGACVNGYGRAMPRSSYANLAGDGASPYHRSVCRSRLSLDTYPLRTPLQFAAAEGNLALVRFLLEDCGADDSLVAPDGYLALRLAAEGNHREVVAYLPARRGGAWRRWQVSHAREMRIIRRAAAGIGGFLAFFLYVIPKAFLYHAPQAIWKKRRHVAGWCARQIKKFPDLARRTGKKMLEGARKLPGGLRKLADAIGKLITRIPGALEIVGLWIWGGLKATFDSLLHIGSRALSFLHTAVAAMIDFFCSITLQNVQDGLVSFIEAIFVGLPKAVWSFLAKFGKVTYEFLGSLFGLLGKLVWYLLYGVWWLILYIPKRFGRILAAVGRLIGKVVREILVWFDPKRL